LFEVWIGDDAPSPNARQVGRALKKLTDAGVPVHFLCGNRDFLLGDTYCAQAGMQRLEEPAALEDYGPPTALIHGDTLCTDDADYQRFRAKVRDPEWQQQTLAKPLWWRKILARFARMISRHRNRNKSAEIMDVNPGAVVECFRSLKIERLIHGHTHRPAIHRFEVDGRSVARIVLGDWHDHQGSAVRIDREGSLALLRLGYNNTGTLEIQTLDSIPAAEA
jgi:UDP-2,3-diacylglucosamine hydrolase